MSSVSPAETPARGTRPRNRRAITLEAAADLFAGRGYAQVSMIDIATATNVGPSALYRHFPSKADLLVEVILDGVTPFAEALSEVDDSTAAEADPSGRLAVALRSLAGAAIEHRTLG